MLEERTDFAAIRAMSITDSEEMAVFQAHDVRIRNVGILVYLVRIMSRDATLSSKTKLCDDVDYLGFVIKRRINSCPISLILSFFLIQF